MRIELRRRVRSLVLAAAAGIVAVHTAPAVADPVAPGTPGAPATAASGGQMVAVWLTRLDDGRRLEVRGQRLGPRGGPRGDELVVSGDGCAVAPDVAMAGDGSFVVASVDCRPDEPGRRLVARRYNRWGQPVGERLVVGRHDTRSLRVALADDGSFAIAFSLQPEVGEHVLQLARFDAATGSLTVAPVDAETAGIPHAGMVVDGLALAEDGTAVILWHGLRGVRSWIAVDTVDPDGFTRRWNLAECAHGGRPAACDDAALGRWGAELLAVWTESQVASESSIVAQRLAGSGEPLGAPWTVVDGTGDERLRSDLDVGTAVTGSPFVVWSERRDATSPASAAVGRPIGPDWHDGALLLVAAGPGARAPRVAGQSPDGAVVVWLDGEGPGTELVARLVRPVDPTDGATPLPR